MICCCERREKWGGTIIAWTYENKVIYLGCRYAYAHRFESTLQRRIEYLFYSRVRKIVVQVIISK